VLCIYLFPIHKLQLIKHLTLYNFTVAGYISLASNTTPFHSYQYPTTNEFMLRAIQIGLQRFITDYPKISTNL